MYIDDYFNLYLKYTIFNNNNKKCIYKKDWGIRIRIQVKVLYQSRRKKKTGSWIP